MLRIAWPNSGAIGTTMMVTASLLVATGWGFDWQAWHAIGTDPTASAQFAMVYAFIAWDGFFAFVAVLMGLFVGLRQLAGLVSPDRPSTSSGSAPSTAAATQADEAPPLTPALWLASWQVGRISVV